MLACTYCLQGTDDGEVLYNSSSLNIRSNDCLKDTSMNTELGQLAYQPLSLTTNSSLALDGQPFQWSMLLSSHCMPGNHCAFIVLCYAFLISFTLPCSFRPLDMLPQAFASEKQRVEVLFCYLTASLYSGFPTKPGY